MTELSKQILENYKVRKTKKQKYKFIELIQKHYPQMQIQETSGFTKSKNLIIGNLSKADTIVCAHYDTGTNLFVSNAWFPRNTLMYVVYQFLIGLPLIFAAIVGAVLLWETSVLLSFAYIYLCFILHILSTCFGLANKNNANCNTSGVVTLFEVLDQVTQDNNKNIAFVLFDNKEKGFVGSTYFKKRYSELMKNKILINLECIGDGDNIMVVQNKTLIDNYTAQVMSAFKKTVDKNIILESSNKVVIPSDQIGFPCYISITAFKKSGKLGFYLDNIRTKKDTICDMKNVTYLKQAILDFSKFIENKE